MPVEKINLSANRGIPADIKNNNTVFKIIFLMEYYILFKTFQNMYNMSTKLTSPPKLKIVSTQPKVSKESIQQVAIVPTSGLNQGPHTPNISSSDVTYHHVGYVQSTVNIGDNKVTFPLYERRKYPRQERYEYYIIENNGIQIPFTQRNDNQLYDGDNVMIPGFDEAFIAKIYPPLEIPYTFPIVV